MDRKEFEMADEDLEKLLDACKPTPAMWGSGGAKMFPTPQENAARAWNELGDRMGFEGSTAQQVHGKGQKFFTAVPKDAIHEHR